MPDRLRVRVCCEDRQHEAFARELLQSRFNVRARDMHFAVAPAGKGAASAWVAKQYADVQLEARATKHQATLCFLVIVDGDNIGTAARIKMIGANNRAPSDRIAVLVPTWSIETWLLWLSGKLVSESQSYKQQLDGAAFRREVRAAVNAWPLERVEEKESIPSLVAARVELKRWSR